MQRNTADRYRESKFQRHLDSPRQSNFGWQTKPLPISRATAGTSPQHGVHDRSNELLRMMPSVAAWIPRELLLLHSKCRQYHGGLWQLDLLGRNRLLAQRPLRISVGQSRHTRFDVRLPEKPHESKARKVANNARFDANLLTSLPRPNLAFLSRIRRQASGAPSAAACPRGESNSSQTPYLLGFDVACHPSLPKDSPFDVLPWQFLASHPFPPR